VGKSKLSKEEIDAKADQLLSTEPRVEPAKPEDLLSTGCALFDIAISKTYPGGIPVGNYMYYVGDSGTAKTWCAFSFLAEASRNPRFKKHRLIFDNVENGALMDIEYFFGKKVFDRLEPPAWNGSEPYYSNTVQELYYNIDINCSKGPCIYIVDSMDALRDDSDEKKFDAEVKRYETGKGEVPGSMGVTKAKTNSQNINRVASSLRDSDSILFLIGQTRDKLGMPFPMKTRSGGHALKFFAHVEAWTKIEEKIKNRYAGKDRDIGDTIQIDLRKNRVCGWHGKISVDFLTGFGFDDVGTSVNYLLEEKHWKYEKKQKGEDDEEESDSKNLTAPEFEFTGKKEKLVELIQDSNREVELHQLVLRVWKEIEEGSRLNRKRKYS